MAKRMNPDERRELILSTAAEQFATLGYRNLSLRQIAAACGMSAPGVMHYFRTLEDLLNAVLQRREEMDMAALGLPLASQLGLLEGVRAAMAYYGERGEEVHQFAIIEGEAVDPAHPAHRYFTERHQRYYRYVEEALRSEYQNGSDLAPVVYAAVEGLRWQWMWGRLDVQQVEERMTQVWETLKPLGIPHAGD